MVAEKHVGGVAVDDGVLILSQELKLARCAQSVRREIVVELPDKAPESHAVEFRERKDALCSLVGEEDVLFRVENQHSVAEPRKNGLELVSLRVGKLELVERGDLRRHDPRQEIEELQVFGLVFDFDRRASHIDRPVDFLGAKKRRAHHGLQRPENRGEFFFGARLPAGRENCHSFLQTLSNHRSTQHLG